MIYLDNAATSKPSANVVRAMVEYLEKDWYNPSSGYRASKTVNEAVEEARAHVAALIDAEPSEIYFTSGGTESNNSALFSVHSMLSTEVSMVTSVIEHSAILRPMEQIQKQGRDVSFLPVDEAGSLKVPEEISAGFVSLMAANNETGVKQPLAEIVSRCRDSGCATHTDAVQIVGKERFSVKEVLVDMLSLSGHKFNGPKGVGALYIRSGFRMSPLFYGGGQESGKRSGTENVPGIIGMGIAAKEALARIDSASTEIAKMRDAFESEVLRRVSGSELNGDLEQRLSGHSHISFENCEAEGLVILLDEYGVQCSSGSACMTGKQQPSHVQLAMGFSKARAKSSLRFTFSHENTMEEALQAAKLVKKAVDKLRSVQNLGTGPVVVYTP